MRLAGGARVDAWPLDFQSVIAAIKDLAHQVLRLAIDREEHAAEVFAEHADRDELHAAEKQHKRGQRGEAGRSRLDLDEVLFEERIVLPPVTRLPSP